MQIESYKYASLDANDWVFDEVSLSKLNLFVGDTATGKTRFLNTIFNLGHFIVSSNYHSGRWSTTLTIDDKLYKYAIESAPGSEDQHRIISEILADMSSGKEEVIVSRNENEFNYEKTRLPKLDKTKTSIDLLRDEDLIKPIFEGFASIMRRDFYSDVLNKTYELKPLLPPIEEKTSMNLTEIFRLNAEVHIRLYLLKKHHKLIYDRIKSLYKNIFPFISDFTVDDLVKIKPTFKSNVLIPCAAIKESGMNQWLGADQLSSGMKKVLLVLTDILAMPSGSIYLVDEYENSLGVNAVNFFPDLLQDPEVKTQVVLTSHHPYIINNIPTNRWYVFRRRGSKVNIAYGEQNVQKYGKSKQQAYIKLINDIG